MRTSSTSTRHGGVHDPLGNEMTGKIADFKDEVKRYLKDLEKAKAQLKENKIENLHEISNEFEEVYKKDENKLLNCLGNLKKILNEIQQVEVEVELEMIRNQRSVERLYLPSYS
jgi:phage-related minor tail protein